MCIIMSKFVIKSMTHGTQYQVETVSRHCGRTLDHMRSWICVSLSGVVTGSCRLRHFSEKRIPWSAHVPILAEVEHGTQDKVEGRHVVTMTSTVSVLRLLVKPAARVLGSDWIDARLCQSTAKPGQHQLRVSGLIVNEDYNRRGGHVLEGVLLVLDAREELEHPWMSEGSGGGSLSLLPHHHTLLLGGVQPQGDVRAGESVVRVQPDHGAHISEDGLDDKRSVCAQMKGVHMGRPR